MGDDRSSTPKPAESGSPKEISMLRIPNLCGLYFFESGESFIDLSD
jgi:hypothetical protein